MPFYRIETGTLRKYHAQWEVNTGLRDFSIAKLLKLGPNWSVQKKYIKSYIPLTTEPRDMTFHMQTHVMYFQLFGVYLYMGPFTRESMQATFNKAP